LTLLGFGAQVVTSVVRLEEAEAARVFSEVLRTTPATVFDSGGFEAELGVGELGDITGMALTLTLTTSPGEERSSGGQQTDAHTSLRLALPSRGEVSGLAGCVVSTRPAGYPGRVVRSSEPLVCSPPTVTSPNSTGVWPSDVSKSCSPAEPRQTRS
jgi:hypothetical protein